MLDSIVDHKLGHSKLSLPHSEVGVLFVLKEFYFKLGARTHISFHRRGLVIPWV
jgi:hypothetical protein